MSPSPQECQQIAESALRTHPHWRNSSPSWVSCLLIAVGLSVWAPQAFSNDPTVDWIRQFGTTFSELGFDASADGLGNVYISGGTYGNLGGINAGSADAFIRKYDASGSLLWSRQLGTRGTDESRGVSADGLGNVYISGYSEGDLGGVNAGSRDAFVSRYDAFGNLVWTRQIGTSGDDDSWGVSADGLGSVYITGYTDGSLSGINAGGHDAFVSKYDESGSLLWTQQLGDSKDEIGFAVSADGQGNVYISGITEGSLGGVNAGISDAFVSKYDASGTLQWTRQPGTAGYDRSNSVSADSLGNVFISGDSNHAGSYDAFVSKYDTLGGILWTQQLGTTESELGFGVSADGLGNVYVAGITDGDLGGANAGSNDAFVSKFDATGKLIWIQQFGNSGSDLASAVSADGLGNVYFTGGTNGNFGGPNAGALDVILVKIADVPEPAGMLTACVSATFAICRRHRPSDA